MRARAIGPCRCNRIRLQGRCLFAHATIDRWSNAPELRATSRPPENKMSVGIDRIANRAAIVCSASVSSFNRRIFGSRAFAAAAKAGAIAVQGPHQLAQKSTRTGRDPVFT